METLFTGGERMKNRWQAWKTGYEEFVEKRGFFLIIGTCVAIIAASAMLSGHTTLTASVAPTLPPRTAQSAAELMQESLAEAIAATPAPTTIRKEWTQPLEELIVLRAFDDARLQRSEVTGIWALHDAVDLKADTGAPVRAITDGIVTAISKKGVLGASIVIDHGQGLCAAYAGMQLLAGLEAGDPVASGQILGFIGGGLVDETDLAPHLHLRVTRDGRSIDPMVILQQ